MLSADRDYRQRRTTTAPATTTHRPSLLVFAHGDLMREQSSLQPHTQQHVTCTTHNSPQATSPPQPQATASPLHWTPSTPTDMTLHLQSACTRPSSRPLACAVALRVFAVPHFCAPTPHAAAHNSRGGAWRPGVGMATPGPDSCLRERNLLNIALLEVLMAAGQVTLCHSLGYGGQRQQDESLQEKRASCHTYERFPMIVSQEMSSEKRCACTHVDMTVSSCQLSSGLRIYTSRDAECSQLLVCSCLV